MKRNDQWFKSSYSNGQSACVEAAMQPHGGLRVRDSKQAEAGPILGFGDTAWKAFLSLATTRH